MTKRGRRTKRISLTVTPIPVSATLKSSAPPGRIRAQKHTSPRTLAIHSQTLLVDWQDQLSQTDNGTPVTTRNAVKRYSAHRSPLSPQPRAS